MVIPSWQCNLYTCPLAFGPSVSKLLAWSISNECGASREGSCRIDSDASRRAVPVCRSASQEAEANEAKQHEQPERPRSYVDADKHKDVEPNAEPVARLGWDELCARDGVALRIVGWRFVLSFPSSLLESICRADKRTRAGSPTSAS